MSKTPTRNQQLELPVLVSLDGSQPSSRASEPRSADTPKSPTAAGTPKASAKDEAIYRAISDNYFRNLD